MSNAWHVFRFVFKDNFKSGWALGYLLFLGLALFSLHYFTGSLTRSLASFISVLLILVPLMSSVVTAFYYYNKMDLWILLISQPIERRSVLLGMYAGISASLLLPMLLSFLIPAMLAWSEAVANINWLMTMVITGSFLTLIFSAITLAIVLRSASRLTGLGLVLFMWLLLTVLYDGAVLAYLFAFSDYNIEQHALIMILLNPVDLTRVVLSLELDIAAMMGYSGVVFKNFFTQSMGQLISLGALVIWTGLPLLLSSRILRKKDF